MNIYTPHTAPPPVLRLSLSLSVLLPLLLSASISRLAHADALPTGDVPKIAVPIVPSDDSPLMADTLTDTLAEADGVLESTERAVALDTLPADEVAQVLDRAVLDKNAAIIAALLPRYQAQADADPILIAYATAVLHEKSGQLKAAIAIYRQILADHPNLTPIRFELAKALFDDKQNAAATEQFNKVKSAHPPDFVVELADAFLAALRQRDWHLWGITPKLSYQYKKVDSNIPSMYSTKKSQLFFSFEKSF